MKPKRKAAEGREGKKLLALARDDRNTKRKKYSMAAREWRRKSKGKKGADVTGGPVGMSKEKRGRGVTVTASSFERGPKGKKGEEPGRI